MCPDLWITSLLFDLNLNLLTGASLLALAKSIYYSITLIIFFFNGSIHFAHFGLEPGMDFEGATETYQHVYRFNSK